MSEEIIDEYPEQGEIMDGFLERFWLASEAFRGESARMAHLY